MWFRASLLVLFASLVWWFNFGAPRVRLYELPHDPIAIPSDAAAIARGRHLVEAIAVCTICHGDDLGGKLAFQDEFLGQGYTPNLTTGAGGVGRHYRDADWVRAIRYGLKPDRHGILFMPSDYYNALTDADLGAMIAYLKSLPPVDNTRTSLELGFLARIMLDLGFAGDVVRAAVIPKTPSTENYLIRLGGCQFCHGADLRGGQGPEPGAPNGPALRGRSWTLEAFSAALRAGQAVDGHRINPKYMPWQGFAHLTDAEVAEIYAALNVSL